MGERLDRKEDQMIHNIAAVIYLGVFFSLLYLVKNVLDSERILDNHPYFRNPLLRVFLILTVAAPLALILKPEYANFAHVILATGLMGTFSIIGFIYNRHIVKVQITLMDTKVDSVVSSQQYLTFRSDRYTQLSPGLFTRRVINPDNILIDKEEEQLREHLTKFDYETEIVLIVRFSKGSKFSAHIHPVPERYYLVEGRVQMTKKVFLKKGDSYTMKALKPHFFFGIEGGVILVGLSKV